MSENTNKVAQPENTTPPEGNGTPAGKTFTQDDIDRIISERLARERAKAEPDPLVERDKALTARENALTCKEYLTEKGYPAALLDILDTTSTDLFKNKVDALVSVLPELNPAIGGKIPVATWGTVNHSSVGHDPVAEAFKRKD